MLIVMKSLFKGDVVMKRFLSFILCFLFTGILLMESSSTAAAETRTLSAGIYNVGKDIPAGEYS
jgi:hypothetical protein